MSETNTIKSDAMEWARKEIGEPFVKMSIVAEKIASGETLSFADALVRLPLSRIEVDYRAVFPILRDAMPLLISEPANLFVMVVNDDASAIDAAWLVSTRENNYVKIKSLDVSDEWAGIALEHLRPERRESLRKAMDDWFGANDRAEVNCVVVVKPKAFATMKRLRGELDAGKRGSLSYLYSIVGECLRDETLIIDPLPRTLARLNELFKVVNVPDGAMKKILGADTHKYKIAIALQGRNYLSPFLYDSSGMSRAGVDIDLLPGDGDPSHIVKVLRKETGADYAFLLSADMLLNFMFEILNRPIPTCAEDSKTIIKKLLFFLRGYKSLWRMHPTPVALKEYIRVPLRLLGLPYDLTRLSWWFLPEMIVDGLGIFLGDVLRSGIIVLKGDEPLAVIMIDSKNRGFEGITVYPADELKPIFAGARGRGELRARLIEAKHYLWDKYRWVEFIHAVDVETLEAGKRLLINRNHGSMLRLPLLLPALVGLRRVLRRGGFIMYPDMMAHEGAKYVKSAGFIKVQSNAIQVPFDGYRKKPRGLLYVRETIYLAAALAGILVTAMYLLN